MGFDEVLEFGSHDGMVCPSHDGLMTVQR